MRQVTVTWHGDVLWTFAAKRGRIFVGEGTEIGLPVPRTEVIGGWISGPFGVLVEPISERLPRAPVSISSSLPFALAAVLHVAVLTMFAYYTYAHPPDPGAEGSERALAMSGYFARIADHDVPPNGTFQTDDRADDDRVSLAPLAFQPIAPSVPKSPRTVSGSKTHGRGGGTGSGEGDSNCGEIARAHHQRWIVFLLTSESRAPVANARYKVTLSDGSVQEGRTDRAGFVCLRGVPGGNAKIEWPGLHTTYLGPAPSPDEITPDG